MKEYVDLGIESFIISGYPHIEECYRFAELVFLKLPLKATTGNNLGSARNAGSFGEVTANVWRCRFASRNPHRQGLVVPGGGFAGATVALHLLKLQQSANLALTVLEPRAVIGAGLTYSAEDPEPRINVAAARMMLLPDGRAYPRRAKSFIKSIHWQIVHPADFHR